MCRFCSISRHSTKDLEPLSNTLGAQWCALELCNRVATGLYNVPVQMSKRSCVALAQLAGPSGALAGFQLPPALFMQNTNHITVHKAQQTNPYTIAQSQIHRLLTLPQSYQSECSLSAEGRSPKKGRSQARPVQSFKPTS